MRFEQSEGVEKGAREISFVGASVEDYVEELGKYRNKELVYIMALNGEKLYSDDTPDEIRQKMTGEMGAERGSE